MISKWVLTLVAGFVVSCSDYGASHDLIRLSGVRPNLVESGDTLQILGSGFVEGSPARISFRGDIYRAGAAPRRNVEIVVRTKDTSKDTITFAVTDELEQAFCGEGANASHAAFHGAVTLAFAAGSDALAPVSGTLRGVSLEIMPKGRTMQAARERQLLSQEALSFLGMDLIEDGASDCCTVANVRGRAALAGIKPGDRLIEFDGVPVRSPTDLIPAGRSRTATVWIRGEGAAKAVPRTIDVQGYRWSIPSELAAAFGALLLALGCIFGLNSQLRRLFGSLTGTVARILPIYSTRTHRARLGTLKALFADLPLPDFASLRIAQVFSVIALGALCAVVSLRRELISGELDLVLWWLVSSVAVSVATLIAHLVQSERSAVMALLFAARALAHQLPLLVLIALAIAVTGSPRISEIVRAQGPWPNSWLIFHDPAFALASILAMGALVPMPEKVDSSATKALARTGTAPGLMDREGSSVAALLRFLIARVHLWIQSVLLVVLLFGGWGANLDSVTEKHGAWLLLPAFVLLAKAWVLITCLSFARALFGSLTHRYTTPWVFKVVFPLGLLCGSISFLWTWGIRQWSLSWAGVSLRCVMLTAFGGLLTILVLRVQRRIRGGARAPLEHYWT